MHELGHLDRQLHARSISKNQLFTTDEDCEKQFEKDHQYIANKLEKKGLPENKIQGFVDQIFQGLNSQIYNTPIDLFIEQKIFDDFPHLRPYQFVSLLQLEREYIQSATNKEVQELVPKKITRTNKILSLVNTIQFKKLYGIDLSAEFNPSGKELDEAEELYKEWLTYFNDDEYAVEYELIKLWANDFGLSGYFNLVDEEQHQQSTLDKTINQIERDPLSLNEMKVLVKKAFLMRMRLPDKWRRPCTSWMRCNTSRIKASTRFARWGLRSACWGAAVSTPTIPTKNTASNRSPAKPFRGDICWPICTRLSRSLNRIWIPASILNRSMSRPRNCMRRGHNYGSL
jgi:hypothetical protein